MDRKQFLIPKIPESFKPYVKGSRVHPCHPAFDWQICLEFPNNYGCSVVTGKYAQGNMELLPLKINKINGKNVPSDCHKDFNLDESESVALKDEEQLEEWLEKISTYKMSRHKKS